MRTRPHARVVTLAALAVLGAAAVPTVGTATFGAPVNLSAPGGDAEFNQVAVAPDGATTVVWTRLNGANYIAQASTRPAGSATFGAPVDLSATGGTARESRVAVAPDGTTTVVWLRQSGGNWTAQAATRPAGSSTFGAPVNLSVPSGSVYGMQVAVAPSGATTAMWVRYDGANYIAQAATRAAGSASFGAPVDISAAGYDADRLDLAVGPDGTATAAWFLTVGGDRIIQTATRAVGSASFGAPVDLTAAGGNADHPQVAFAPDGTTIIAWERRAGANFIVQEATRAAGSASFGATVNLSAPGQDAEVPQIGIDGTGATTVTWIRYDGVNYVVQAATRATASAAFGTTMDLSPAGSDSRSPQIAVGPDGATTIAWSGSVASTWTLQVATRAAGAGTFAAAFNMSAAGGSAYDPSLATGQDGATTITWYRYDGANYVVQAASAAGSAPARARLTVATDGTGAGTVSSAPAGINCGSTCASDFDRNASVTLTATAAAGSTFTGWSGGCTGSAGTCTVVLTAATTVTATFAAASTDSGGGSASATAPAVLKVTSVTPQILALTSRVQVPGAGVVVQRARTTGSGAIAVCAATKRVATSATTTMRCALTPTARRLLRQRPLRVRLITTFTPTGGTAQVSTSLVTLPARTRAPAVVG